MAIKTVNAENLAEYAASRPNGGQVTPDVINPESGVKGEVVETISTAPDPGKQPDKSAKQSAKEEAPKERKDKVQDRIDELTRLRKEAEEGWESEYEQRLKLEGELNALKAKPSEEKAGPKPQEIELPDPAKYTDQSLFLKDYAEAVERRAEVKAEAKAAKAEAERRQREADAAMVEKVAKAKADFEDFESVIDAADKRTRADLAPFIKAAIFESEFGAHLAYTLAKDQALEKRITALGPVRGLFALGELEKQWAKKPEAKAEGAPPPDTSAKSAQPPKPPEPISKLKEGSGIVQSDLSQPMAFKDYLRGRREQLRERRR
jgi:hypothetical protein